MNEQTTNLRFKKMNINKLNKMSKKKPITEEDAIRIAKAESKKKPQKNSFTKRAKKAAEKNKKN